MSRSYARSQPTSRPELYEFSLVSARVWTCGEADEQLPFVRTDPWMRPFTSIIPLQRLTAELTRLRHTDPDTPHGGAGPWRSAMTSLEL